MENEIYITRKEKWFETKHGNDIPLEEWLAFVKNDPDMRLDNFSVATLENGELFRYDNPGAAVYIHRAAGETDCHEIAFEYLSGNIKVNAQSDDNIMEKIRHIAFKLGAHIQAETEAQTDEIPLEEPYDPKPVFSFSDLLEPVKKALHKLEHKPDETSLNPLPEADKKKT